MALTVALGLGLLLLFVPGLLLLRGVAGLSWFAALATAAPCSLGFTAFVGLLPGALGGFHPLGYAVALALLAVLVVVLRRRRPAERAADPGPGEPPTAAAWAGAGLGALVSAYVWFPAVWPVSAVPQNYDFIWHGYVTAVIRSLGVGNPFQLVPLDPLSPGGSTDYYPIGLHLVWDLASTGSTSVAPALNAVQFLLAVVVTPLGVAALARQLAPRLPVVALTAPALTGLTVVFAPKIVGLPPYTGTLALLAPALTLLLLLRDRGWDLRLGAVATLVVQVMFAVQPAAAFTLALLGGTAVLDGVVRRPGPLPRWQELRRIAVWAVAAAVVAAPWALAATSKAGATTGKLRKSYTTLPNAVRDIAELNWVGHSAPWWFLLLVLCAWIGLGLLAVRGVTWPLLGYVGFAGLYVVAGGYPGLVRRMLTGPWVGEWYRIAPVAALMACLGLAAFLGAVPELAERLLSAGRRTAAGTAEPGPSGPVGTGRPAAPVLALTAVVALVVVGLWGLRQADPARQFVVSSRTPTLVTPGKVAAFDWLRGHVSPRERVLNDWQQGTSWMYAVAGVVPLEPYITTVDHEPWRDQLVTDLRDLGDPAVRRRFRDAGIHYVVQSRIILPGRESTLSVPARATWLQLVFSSGDTTVYRITD